MPKVALVPAGKAASSWESGATGHNLPRQECYQWVIVIDINLSSGSTAIMFNHTATELSEVVWW